MYCCSTATGDYWLPGANVVGLATASIDESAELRWKEFGFAITLQCFQCNITVTVAASFDSSSFTLPSSTILVSAVYYIELSEEPSVPATVEFDHLDLLNSSSQNMMFGVARKDQPYTFRLFSGDFTSRKLHGKFRLPKSRRLLAAFCLQRSEEKYSAHVFCEHEGQSLWRLTVVTIPRLTAYKQVGLIG